MRRKNLAWNFWMRIFVWFPIQKFQPVVYINAPSLLHFAQEKLSKSSVCVCVNRLNTQLTFSQARKSTHAHHTTINNLITNKSAMFFEASTTSSLARSVSCSKREPSQFINKGKELDKGKRMKWNDAEHETASSYQRLCVCVIFSSLLFEKHFPFGFQGTKSWLFY